MKSYVICFVLFGIMSAATAEEAKPQVPPAKEGVKSLMHQFWGHIESLRKYMGSADEFKDPKNDIFISDKLKDMRKLVSKAKHHTLLNSPNFAFSRKVLENHVSEIERVFKAGNKDYARWMLNSTTSICMSCHTQYPVDPAATTIPDVGTGTTFADAEFLFATRRYESAVQIYRKLVAGFPGNNLKPNELENSIRRLVAIHARIKREPKVGTEELENVLKNKDLPEYLKRDTAAWKALFEKWKSDPDVDPKTVSAADLTKWVEKQFEKTLWDRMVPASDPRAVTYLRVSGILYEYLQLHPKSEITPKILYWLARCEYRLDTNFFYSLGDLYLRECMRNFSKDEFAKKCYFEYEDNIIMAFTGSRGTYVPPDVMRELKDLRKVVGIKPGESQK